MNSTVSVILFVLLLLLGAALLWWKDLNRKQEAHKTEMRRRKEAERQAQALHDMSLAIEETARNVRASTEALSQRQDRLRDAMDARIDAMQSSNERKLEQMRRLVDEQLQENLTKSFSNVNEQLADVNRGLGRMHSLMNELGDMKKVLGGVKTRGVWGEVRLRVLLEDMLAPGQYLENAAIPAGSANRVEFAVRMPGTDGEILLPIDSKFPQEDYLRLVEATENADPNAIRECGAQFERALTEQAKKISEKYIRPPQTTEFAVMFLPIESLYAEAVRRMGLCEKLQNRHHILVAGPNTLAALLTNLRTGYTTMKLEKQSGEILRTLTEVREAFGKYAESADMVRRNLSKTMDSMDALDVRTRRIRKLLDSIESESLPEEDDEIPDLV